jgi:hypothetical protein
MSGQSVPLTVKEKFLIAMIAVFFLLLFHLALVFEINWDEFAFLNRVYDHTREKLTSQLQTIFVHAFKWLFFVSTNEVDQIVAARIVMLALFVAINYFLYAVSCRFMSREAALMAVIFYLSFSYVVRHGASFRADPLITFLMMGAIWLIICGLLSMTRQGIAGILIGLAGLISIKSIFFVPTLGALLLWRWTLSENSTKNIFVVVLPVITAAIAFAALYMAHSTTLSKAASSTIFINKAFNWTIGQWDIFPLWHWFIWSFVNNPLYWIVLIAGIVVALRRAISGAVRSRIDAVLALSFCLVLLSLLFYRNSFPYFYAVILAPASVLCGLAMDKLSENQFGRIIGLATITGLGINFSVAYVNASSQDNRYQRLTLDVVHRAFPDPAPYTDCCAMISSFPKQGFFMTDWGMNSYYERGKPFLQNSMEADLPRFFIANLDGLTAPKLRDGKFGPKHFRRLMPDDATILRDYYIHHWGAIYVAGQSFAMTSNSSLKSFEILISGKYALEGSALVHIDGKSVLPGEISNLAAGSHKILMPAGNGQVVCDGVVHLICRQ